MTHPPLAPSTTLPPAQPPLSTTPTLAWLLGVHGLVWTLLQWLAQGNLDGYHDMLENHAWSQTFAWGTFKHPPFFAWVVGLWFELFPTTDWAYRALSSSNVVVALLGVAALAGRLGLARHATVAVLLLLWTLPYTTLAAKFNANSQLLSLWPWTAVALLASLQSRGWRAWAWNTALGALAAACLLSKYYSGVFLLGFVAVALTRTDGRRWLFSAWPLLSLGVFALLLWPHLRWLQAHDFATLGYAMNQNGDGDGGPHWGYLAKFALTPLAYWGTAWLAVTGASAFARRPGLGTGLRAWGRALVLSWRPQGWGDTLFWLAVLPGGITLLFGLAGLVELSTPWAIPIGYAFSLLWLRNLATPCGAAEVQRVQTGLLRAAWPVLVAVVLGGAAYGAHRAQSGHPDYYRPSEQVAQDILALWQREAPGVPLGWSGGAWADNALLGFYGDARVRAVPGTPDTHPATLAPVADWARQGGVLICPLGPQGRPPAPSRSARPKPDCLAESAAWLRARGQDDQPQRLAVARQGLRFPAPVVFDYAVFLYRPAPAGHTP